MDMRLGFGRQRIGCSWGNLKQEAEVLWRLQRSDADIELRLAMNRCIVAHEIELREQMHRLAGSQIGVLLGGAERRQVKELPGALLIVLRGRRIQIQLGT